MKTKDELTPEEKRIIELCDSMRNTRKEIAEKQANLAELQDEYDRLTWPGLFKNNP